MLSNGVVGASDGKNGVAVRAKVKFHGAYAIMGNVCRIHEIRIWGMVYYNKMEGEMERGEEN